MILVKFFVFALDYFSKIYNKKAMEQKIGRNILCFKSPFERDK